MRSPSKGERSPSKGDWYDALGRDPVCHISIGAMNEGASIGGTVSRSYEARTNTKA